MGDDQADAELVQKVSELGRVLPTGQLFLQGEVLLLDEGRLLVLVGVRDDDLVKVHSQIAHKRRGLSPALSRIGLSQVW